MSKWITFITLTGLVATVLLAPLDASGQWKKFMPRITDRGADLEVDAIYESEENLIDGSGTNYSDLSLREKITLWGEGYIYHPRFIIFLAKVSGALRQERFENDPSGTDTDSWTEDEYEFRVKLLPEHPYNLELYTMLTHPFVRGLFVGDLRTEVREKGAIFKYKKRPLQFYADYIDYEVSNILYSTDTKRFDASGTVYTNAFTQTVGYSHIDSTTNTNSSTTDDIMRIANTLSLFERATLQSGFDYQTSEQTGPDIKRDDETINWTENFHLQLPWNFEADLRYYLYDDTTKGLEVPGTLDNEFVTKTKTTTFTLTHRLYSSLTSQYLWNDVENRTTTGDSDSTQNALIFTYNKLIPGGSLLADFYVRETRSSRKGALAALDEPHRSSLFEEFLLAADDIDRQTIVVRVRDPLTAQLFTLVPDVNYVVVPEDPKTGIIVFSLPPEVTISDPFATFEFLVSYATASETAALRTDDLGYSMQFSLFNNRVIPYYRFYMTKQHVISGTIIGEPEDTTSHTVGVTLRRLPYWLWAEYNRMYSNIKPQQRYRIEGNYSNNITLSTVLSARLYYEKTKYYESFYTPTPYTDTLKGVEVKLLSNVPLRNLSANLTGSYFERTAIYKSKTWLANASLLWKIGKLEVTFGASYINTQSDVIDQKQTTKYQYYSLNIKRTLF